MELEIFVAACNREREVCAGKLEECPLVFDNEDVTLANGHFGVEIDESSFGKKRKSGRGKKFRKYSVFGIVEKNGTRCVLYVVRDRKRTTLLPLIKKHIRPTCHISHDGYTVYDSLASDGYSHSSVNHSVEFVSSDGTHTNTIEGLWGLLKQRISRMHGLPSLKSLAACLDEFSYRQLYSDESGCIWKALSQDIAVD